MANWNIDELKNIISKCNTKTEVLQKMGLKNNGGNFNTLTHIIKMNDINIEHFNYKFIKTLVYMKYDDIHTILIEKSPYKSSNSLKKRLYKEGLKERKCELCGQDENWNGKKMALILDHINGEHIDNRLENLRIVCPNCNATLETHCKGNAKKHKNINLCKCGNSRKRNNTYCSECSDEYYKNKKIGIKKCSCGNIIKNESKQCLKCYNLSQRTKDRPSYNILLIDIKELGYSGTGRKYGVSDNSIRKWKKYYENLNQ